MIFKYVFWHTWNQTSLYASYAEYFDTNHYGPFFSLIIAPFAVVPLPVGLILWHVLMALLLYVCIRKLPLNQGKQIFIYWFCAHELLTALFMDQFNIVTVALIVASFYCVEKQKDILAACFIMIGTFVKLYGLERCEELVATYTNYAIDALNTFSDTSFLEALAKSLTERRV